MRMASRQVPGIGRVVSWPATISMCSPFKRPECQLPDLMGWIRADAADAADAADTGTEAVGCGLG